MTTEVTPELSAEEITPEVLRLARRLMSQPGILATEARMREQRAASRAKATVHVCPYCQTKGVPIQVGEYQFTRRRDDCCQQALFDAARTALYVSTASSTSKDVSLQQARLQQARFYAVLKAQITDKALSRELATHELLCTGR